MSAPRVDPALVRAIALRLSAVLALQLAAIAAYYSVITMYLKLPFGSGATPFAVAQWWHLAAGDALFVGAALLRRHARGSLAEGVGSLVPLAALAFGAWAGTDPPVGRVLVAFLLLAPTALLLAWALPPPSASGGGAS